MGRSPRRPSRGRAQGRTRSRAPGQVHVGSCSRRCCGQKVLVKAFCAGLASADFRLKFPAIPASVSASVSGIRERARRAAGPGSMGIGGTGCRTSARADEGRRAVCTLSRKRANKDFSENGSSQGQNLALTVLFVPNSLDKNFPKDLTKACGVSVVGDLILQPWDTMSLRTADLGSVCVARAVRLD